MSNASVTEEDRKVAATIGNAMLEYVRFLAVAHRNGVGLEAEEAVRRTVADSIENAIANHRIASIDATVREPAPLFPIASALD